MFRMYSKKCEYALRVVSCIPFEKVTQKFSVKDLSQKAEVPESYARKAFQSLAQEGILSAVSGPGGGYVFNEDPQNISLYHFILALDGDETFERCIMGLPQCDCVNPCPVHHVWSRMKQTMVEEMRSKTLAELMIAAQKRSDLSEGILI